MLLVLGSWTCTARDAILEYSSLDTPLACCFYHKLPSKNKDDLVHYPWQETEYEVELVVNAGDADTEMCLQDILVRKGLACKLTKDDAINLLNNKIDEKELAITLAAKRDMFQSNFSPSKSNGSSRRTLFGLK